MHTLHMHQRINLYEFFKAAYMREVSNVERMHAILDSVDRMACDVQGDLLSR